MRLACRIVVLFLCLSLPVFAQDLSYYSKMGKLTPHVPGLTAQQSLLLYKSRGVVFHVYKSGRVMGATVFQPGLTPPAARSIGVNELVPGVGACGVIIGMPGSRFTPFPSRVEPKISTGPSTT